MHHRARMVAAATALLFCASIAAGALPRVAISKDGKGFVAGDKPFVPFGVNYFRPGTGWAPKLWKTFDADATRQDLRRLKSMGGNCVRVFLTAASFYTEPGRLNEEGIARFDQFLSIAEECGIYVHPTGPDHWEGRASWVSADPYADEKHMEALEGFWKLFAARYKGRSTLFAYDLLNEPHVRWDTPQMRRKWGGYLASRFGSLATAAKFLGVQTPEPGGELPIPKAEDKAGDRALLAYQDFREFLADEWTRRQAEAIRSADPDALVTVGFIQWSIPAALPRTDMYAAFRPVRQAKFLDFLEVHFYPLESGAYQYEDPEKEMRNLAYLEAVVREVALAGKPVVVAEYGWFGGGALPGQKRVGSEEDQARWCSRLIETTAPFATGWLNWGFYDHPEARDVTVHTGLLTPDGKEKAWGRRFAQIAAQLPARSAQPKRPDLPWEQCITSPKASRQFMNEYVQAFKGE